MIALLGDSKAIGAPAYNRDAMPAPAPYFDMVREMKKAFNYRLPLVTDAGQHGIKAAARAFRTTVPTVRKWLRR